MQARAPLWGANVGRIFTQKISRPRSRSFTRAREQPLLCYPVFWSKLEYQCRARLHHDQAKKKQPASVCKPRVPLKIRIQSPFNNTSISPLGKAMQGSIQPATNLTHTSSFGMASIGFHSAFQFIRLSKPLFIRHSKLKPIRHSPTDEPAKTEPTFHCRMRTNTGPNSISMLPPDHFHDRTNTPSPVQNTPSPVQNPLPPNQP